VSSGRVEDDAIYARIQELVPIACIDALPYRRSINGYEVCLIRRAVPAGGLGWTLIGGGVYRGETLGEALARHLRGTLGPDVRWDDPDYDRPDAVGQYFPARQGFPVDPRKHAIALTYLVEMTGQPVAEGEAEDFGWFDPRALPQSTEVGFGQGRVLGVLISRLSRA
jgi:ADP-ribose pyrophosphatase YjhB (NUDIX family)